MQCLNTDIALFDIHELSFQKWWSKDEIQREVFFF